MDELDRYPKTSSVRLSEIDQDLKDLLISYQRNSELHFSTIFKKHIRLLGLHSKLAAGKATTASFVGSFLKPEVLLKVWSFMHS